MEQRATTWAAVCLSVGVGVGVIAGCGDGGADTCASDCAADASDGVDATSSADATSPDAAALPDGAVGAVDAAPAVDAASGSPKTSLAVCWTEPDCHRALVVSHGGDWSALGAPFLSRDAFEQAYALGADGIETDVQVTADGVPVLMHSSPIEWYESLDCAGQLIEEMTAEQITQCHLAASPTQTVQRLDDALAWSEGKLILELDVKDTEDLAATVATVIAASATDRAFIMVSVGEIETAIPAISDWDQLHYMVNVSDPGQVAGVVDLAPSHNVFMLELDRSYDGFDEAQMTALITDTLHPAGLKPFTSSDNLGSPASHLDAYRQGFDVILSYGCANGVAAAATINEERGYSP